jgi:hypothetical protein
VAGVSLKSSMTSTAILAVPSTPVKFAGVIYVLHAFQKKSKKGIATPQRDIDLIKARLRRAEEHYKESYLKGTKT